MLYQDERWALPEWPQPSALSSTIEEWDFFKHNMKKTKLDISIELEGVEDIHMEENIQVDEQPPLSESWTAKLFPNVEDESEFDLAGDLYTGNDEDEKEESEWFRDDMEVVDLVESFWPKITVTREERRRWCKPWKRALVLRLLGKNISLKF